MATYGPGIDQSQQAKSVSHIIISDYYKYYNLFIIIALIYSVKLKL